MKKSILSLSAAVALGGLGFISTAGAVIVFDPLSGDAGAAASGAKLYQHVAGTGHILLTPYFSAQGTNATLINIVNTDTVNGKAVKVRFRGASNSDDVMDFTLLMSPGDVWSGQISRDANGLAQIAHSSDETTCTLPDASQWPGEFNTLRLPSYLSGDTLNSLTREGYVEVLNMADIVPDSAANSVYTAIKHVANKAPCTSSVLQPLLSQTVLTSAQALASYDLAAPTGGLMGSWAVLNQDQFGVFSGAQTAMIVTTDTVIGANSTVNSAAGNIMFFPQIEVAYGAVAAGSTFTYTIGDVTADPLLTGIGATPTSFVNPLWFDLPDLSTPILNVTNVTPAVTEPLPVYQADSLTATMAKPNVMNEWISATGSVPFDTDWVVSQPTRRYHVAVNYGGSAAAATLVSRASAFTSYSSATLSNTNYGPMACLPFGIAAMNREESGTSLGASFSPGRTTSTCGEVFTIQFSPTSVLAAAITTTSVNSIVTSLGGAGWAQLSAPAAAAQGVPMLGYSAIQFSNETTGAVYNETLPHRWNSGN